MNITIVSLSTEEHTIFGYGATEGDDGPSSGCRGCRRRHGENTCLMTRENETAAAV